MKGNKQHHLVPKTYLKYFSEHRDGKSIAVLHYNHPFKKRIEIKDSGSNTFCKRNFYHTTQLNNPKDIELFFARSIEPNYNILMGEIENEKPIFDYITKIKLLEWVLYAKLRSPMWRVLIQSGLEDLGHKFDFDSKELREEHLQIISNETIFDMVAEIYDKNLSSKKWHILKAPSNKAWITSDNPGFSLNVDEYDKETDTFYPNPFWTNIRHDTVLYFPLSSKYCLRIQPYNEGEDVTLNISNSPIRFEIADENDLKWINGWTFCTHHSILIGARREDLKIFEEIKNLPNDE